MTSSVLFCSAKEGYGKEDGYISFLGPDDEQMRRKQGQGKIRRDGEREKRRRAEFSSLRILSFSDSAFTRSLKYSPQ